MKTAISQWQGRISPVFDVAQEVLLVEIKGSKVLEVQRVSLSCSSPFERTREIVALGTELLVCGAISLEYEKVLIQAGIHVIGFCCGEVEAVLAALEKGQFGGKRFRMPGFNGRKVHFGPTRRSTPDRGQRRGGGPAASSMGGGHPRRRRGAVLETDV
jgi:predicted Fe-Mo cluster-binding NifX family protein